MSQDLVDLRRRAQEHAAIGNYWARKCLGLIQMVEDLRRDGDLLAAAALAVAISEGDGQTDLGPEDLPAA